MFALIDCNNFYASCERVFDPKLLQKPIIILSNNDGCVIARSNEAKAAGIPMGAPMFQYQKIIHQKKIIVRSANFELYGDMSHRVMSLLQEYGAQTEIYSIDEAFLYFDAISNQDAHRLAIDIQKSITQKTGIPIGVGFATTKSLAKVANRIAKTYPETTHNAYVIDTELKRIKALKWLKIEDVWGVGRGHAKTFERIGIRNAYEFTQLSEDLVRSQFSVVGLRLQKDLQGNPTLSLEREGAKKNISTTRSFDQHLTQYDLLQERIASFAIASAEKLRRQRMHCNTVSVFVRSNKHRKDLVQYRNSIDIRLPYPTHSSIEISKFAMMALAQIFKQGIAYKKAGVTLSDFNSDKEVQTKLFDNSNPKHAPLMRTIDDVNSQFGRNQVKFGSQNLKRNSDTAQQRLSPCYTTRLSDIISIKV